MLARHRILSVVMVSALATLAGCGSDGTEVPVEESDTGSPTEDTGSTPLDASDLDCTRWWRSTHRMLLVPWQCAPRQKKVVSRRA